MPPLLVSLVLASTGVTGDALAPYRGQPVLSVDVISPQEEDAAELRPLIGIEPGYLLSTDDIEAALRRIYALGRFCDVGVSAERRSGTVSLHFYVEPLRRVTELEIDGLEEADGDAMRQALRINPGDEVDSKTQTRLERRSRAYLARAGFPNAELLVEVNNEERRTAASIHVIVNEGEPLRVRRVRFTGRPRLKRNVLERLVETEAGGIADRDVIEADRNRLAQEYREHGFLRARIHPPAIEVRAGYADVTFEIDAGDRVVIELLGNTLLTRKDVLSLWPEPSGALREADVSVFGDRITEAYKRLGYPRARTRIRATRNAGEETATYAILVDEGSPFRVTAIDFIGSRAFAPHLLAEQVRAVLARQLEADDVIRRMSADRPCLAFPPRLRPEGERCALVEPRPEQRWVPEIYEAALEEITAAYAGFGFLSARIGPAEPVFGDATITVRIPVVEGPQTFINAIQFRDNEALPSDRLLAIVEDATRGEAHDVAIAPGSPLSAAAVEDGRIAILRRYRDLGYLYAKVFTDVRVSKDRRSAEVVYRFEEGPQVRIDRVLIRGNRYTRESVIRNRLSTRPGDLYRLEQALEDQRTVASLGVFSSVRVKLLDEKTPAERKDLVAEVAERNRHRIEPHIGLSTADGIRGGVAYTFLNVLGTGATGTSSIRVNRQFLFGLYGEFAEPMRTRYDDFSIVDEIERELRVGLSSPRWVDLPFDPSARIDVVHERDNAIPYSLDSYAVILGFDSLLSKRLTLSIEPQFAVSSLECVAPDTDAESVDKTRCVEQIPGVRPAIGRTQTGVRSVFKVSPSITLDLRDDPFNPRRGLKASAGLTYAVGSVRENLQAGASDPLTFTRMQASVAAYIPWQKVVLALSAAGGLIARRSELEQIDERFFLGGRSSLRGFVESALLAEDACVAERPANASPDWTPPERPAGCNEQIQTPRGVAPLTTGGNAYLLGKAELRLPLTADFSLGLFVDAGNLWALPPDLSSFGALSNLRIRYGLGAGLRFNTPVGPLAFDIGFNPEPNEAQGERLYVPHFSVGVF